MRLNFLTSVQVDVKVRLTMNDARNMFKNNYMERRVAGIFKRRGKCVLALRLIINSKIIVIILYEAGY